MNSEQPTIVATYFDLPPIDTSQLQQIAADTKCRFGHGAKQWRLTFDAITIIRCINKTIPQHVNQLFETFGPDIMSSFDAVQIIIQRNVIALLSEVFQAGAQVQILPQIFAVFLPKLITKSQQSEHKIIKDECMVCISHLVLNCYFHEAALVAVTQFSADNKRPVNTQKFSLQIMAKLIKSLGQGIQQFSTQTLSMLMQALCFLLESGKQEVQTYVFQITTYLHQLVGEQNFTNWMTVSLTPAQGQNLIKQVQDQIRKKSKCKQLSVMKQRNSYIGHFETREQFENCEHFKEFVKDKQLANNFLDLNQVRNENVNYNQQQFY